MNDRKTLISSGEHLHALRHLGESYTDAEYVEAVEAARAGGAGELYADVVLGVDVDDLLRGVEEKDDSVQLDNGPKNDLVGAEVGHVLNAKRGEPLRGTDTQRRADEILRRRGLRPEAASHAEMLDALRQVSS